LKSDGDPAAFTLVIVLRASDTPGMTAKGVTQDGHLLAPGVVLRVRAGRPRRSVLGADVEFKVGVWHASDRGVRRDDPRKGSNTVRIVPPAGIGPATHGLRPRHKGLGQALDPILLAAASRAMPRSRWASFVVRPGRVRKPRFGSRRPAILVDEPARHVPSLDALALSTQRLGCRSASSDPAPAEVVRRPDLPSSTCRKMDTGPPPEPLVARRKRERAGSVRP
jgi:hypothetical protein